MPNFKRHGKVIFGVEFNKAESEAIEKAIEETQREVMADYIRDAEDRIDAQVLWFLHTRMGLETEELKQAYYDFADSINELISYYEMPEEDGAWTCMEKLKDMGVDILELKKGNRE